MLSEECAAEYRKQAEAVAIFGLEKKPGRPAEESKCLAGADKYDPHGLSRITAWPAWAPPQPHDPRLAHSRIVARAEMDFGIGRREVVMPFADPIALERAIDAAWQRVRGSTAPIISLAEIVRDVMAKCPRADEAYVRRELKRRIEAYQPRLRRKKVR